MDLSRIQIEARRRESWQALDLGCVMAKAWWKPLFLSWVIPSAIAYAVFTLIFYRHPWIAPWLIWWCKPLFDRGQIYVASRALFDVQTSTAEMIKALPKLYKVDLLPSLTWRRFSMTRSHDLSVSILEGLTGKKRQQRLRHLHQGGANAATWLTIICVHLEWMFLLGAIALFVLMIPEEVPIATSGWILMKQGLLPFISEVLSFVAMVLIAPFYTMAGFALYVSRRIDLEAWDIEIRFRHLAARQKSKPSQNFPRVAVLLVVFFLCLSPNIGFSSGHESTLSSHENTAVLPEADLEKGVISKQAMAKKQVFEILEGEDFHNRSVESSWRLKKREAENPEDAVLPEWFIHFIEFLEDLAGDEAEANGFVFNFVGVAKILEFFLWLSLGVFALFLFVRYRKGLAFFTHKPRKKDARSSPPEMLFALDVRPEHLPEDVPTQVQTLWQAGEKRPALALLYRATLSKLIHVFGFVFYEAHTESECLAIVQQRGQKEITAFTGQLTLHWQTLAYGHHVPASDEFDALLADWRELFLHES